MMKVQLSVGLLLGVMISSPALAQKAGLDYSDDEHGFRAEFPCPRPAQLYRMKFESVDIKQEGFTGWKSGLPVYGGDLFVVVCNDLTSGKLKGKSDIEIIRTCYSEISGIEKLVPQKRKVGVAKSDGYEFTVTYNDGSRSRNVCTRIGNRFYRLVATCADLQPGVAPDPFSNDFVDSLEVDKFFDSFELLGATKRAKGK